MQNISRWIQNTAMQWSRDGGFESPLRLLDGALRDTRPDILSTRIIEINSSIPYRFETSDFKGEMLFYVDGLPSTPARLFKDRKRKSHLIVQVGSVYVTARRSWWDE
jgi:hypothetical protein